jgi:hypothetical protein
MLPVIAINPKLREEQCDYETCARGKQHLNRCQKTSAHASYFSEWLKRAMGGGRRHHSEGCRYRT